MNGWKLAPSLIGAICLAAALLLAASGWLREITGNRASRFTSVHAAQELPALTGLSADSIFNTGDAKTLDAFPGVGEVISQRIVETREALGGFMFPEDLMLVKGIGEKTFGKIMAVFDEALVPVWTAGE